MNKKLSYIEAKSILYSLKIKSSSEYGRLFKDKKIPSGIPRNPWRDYDEFISWGDFLGNNIISNKYWVFKTYEESQDYLLSQGIDSKEKFERWRKDNKNTGVPADPRNHFKHQWKGWGEFFKTYRIPDQIKHKMFYSYEKAKEYIKQFNFKSESEFYRWSRSKNKPYFIPSNPRDTYKDNFISMSDFLDNGKKEFKNYQECKKFVQDLKFNSIRDFKNWIESEKRDMSVPSKPSETYKKEFEGYANFLGYIPKESVGEKTISSILKSNKINHKIQYKIDDCKDINPLPFDIAILKEDNLICLIEYQGIQHFKSIPYFGGERALESTKKRDKIKKEYCESNKIKLIEISYKENIELKLKEELDKLEIFINLNLEREPALNRHFLDYNECRDIIQKLEIKSVIEYYKSNKPEMVPYNPEIQYKHNGWISWGEFLGTNKVQSKKAVFVSFDECKKWFKDNNIKSGEDWRIKRKFKPNNIPCHPDKIYVTQWKGWKDFLYN